MAPIPRSPEVVPLPRYRGGPGSECLSRTRPDSLQLCLRLSPAPNGATPDWLTAVHQRGITFDSVQPVEVDIDFTRRWHRLLDLESAIELFKVFYSLLLTNRGV
jgi:hypothetical protein